MTTILVIEDNSEIRENISEILELAGYAVVAATDGKEGIKMALSSMPQLIICDIMMPNLDGYGVLHSLQKNIQFPNIPFIFLSAKNEKQDVRLGMQLGADDYITKPFNPTELLHAIEIRLQKHNKVNEQLQKLVITDSTLEPLFTLELLLEQAHISVYSKKQLIYKEGSWPTGIFFIEKGKVKTCKVNDDGKELITALYTAGDFFGYTALLENVAYHEYAEALDDAEIKFINKENFDKILHAHPQTAIKFIKSLAKTVREKEEHLLGIAYNSLRKKVADALLQLYTTYYNNEDALFSIHISRENLATLAGTATESVIRTLSEFKQEKIIDIKDGNLIITKVEKLQQMLN
jgi:CRP/FNR family transcriptional regulator, cyclic AMP receptor protein